MPSCTAGLAPDAWKGFGALAGQLDRRNRQHGRYKRNARDATGAIWPCGTCRQCYLHRLVAILLASKNFADRFNAWAKVPEDRIRMMDSAALMMAEEERTPAMRDYLYLAAVAIGVTWISTELASVLF